MTADDSSGATLRSREDTILGALLLATGIGVVELYSFEVSAAFIVGALFSHALTRYVDWKKWGGRDAR